MTFKPRSPRFNANQHDHGDKLPSDLEELIEAIASFPESHRQNLQAICGRVVDEVRLRARILNVAKEALERMRLDMTLTQFDLECTRRERDDFKGQLKKRGK